MDIWGQRVTTRLNVCQQLSVHCIVFDFQSSVTFGANLKHLIEDAFRYVEAIQSKLFNFSNAAIDSQLQSFSTKQTARGKRTLISRPFASQGLARAHLCWRYHALDFYLSIVSIVWQNFCDKSFNKKSYDFIDNHFHKVFSSKPINSFPTLVLNHRIRL